MLVPRLAHGLMHGAVSQCGIESAASAMPYMATRCDAGTFGRRARAARVALGGSRLPQAFIR